MSVPGLNQVKEYMQDLLNKHDRLMRGTIDLRSAMDFDRKAQTVLQSTFPGRCVCFGQQQMPYPFTVFRVF